MQRNRPLTRRDRIMRNLTDRGIHVFEHHHPFRTVTFVEDEEEYKYAILGDSLVFGVYIKNALVISCPGGRISRVDTPAIMQYLILKGVQGVGLMRTKPRKSPSSCEPSSTTCWTRTSSRASSRCQAAGDTRRRSIA